MDMLFNASQKLILVKDMTNILNFDLINQEFNKLTFKNNVSNLISEEMHFFDKEIFDNERKVLLEDCCQYLIHTANMGPFFEGLRMTNSWGNVTAPGASHHEHLHPFSVVSGTIYLDANPGNLKLFIESYLPQIPYFITQNKSYVSLYSLLNDAKINFEEQNFLKNHMVLFLSNSNHFVDKIDETLPNRRSIAFNTFWTGLTGIKEEALGSITY
jgi:hypothetical protein